MRGEPQKYDSYSQFTNSGEVWIGVIPRHWATLRNKFAASYAKGRNPKELHFDSGEGLVPYLSMGYLRGHSEAQHASIEPGCVLTEEEQILIIWDGSNAGEFVKGKDGLLSSTMAKADVSSIFCVGYYWFVCKAFEPEMRRTTVGMGIPHVDGDQLRCASLPLPTYEEQVQIAKFLDYETAKIDALIEKQQQLIALLKEKRQAVISHAVTKGLNPDAPMRDSGVEWLGEVPANWEVTKLFHLSSRIGDGLHGTPDYEDSTGLYFVNGNNLEDGRIVVGSSAKEVPLAEYEKHYIPMSGSTVLLSINGTIGNVAIYTHEKVILGKSAAYINCLSHLEPRFLQTFFLSKNARRYYELVSTGTTISNLSLDSIRQLRIGLPDKSEQKAIVKYCETQSGKYEALIGAASTMAERLQERRTALISAAVTGKIDVRGWKAPESQTEAEAA